MSPAVTSKLVDIIYFLIPVAILVAGIIFWEKNYGKTESKKENSTEEN